jgi:hypothetical protein
MAKDMENKIKEPKIKKEKAPKAPKEKKAKRSKYPDCILDLQSL